MLKISPIVVNNFSKFVSKNSKSILFSSMLGLAVAGAFSVNGCSKIVPLIEDKFEKFDSTKVDKDKNVEIVIDTSLNVVEHEITL